MLILSLIFGPQVLDQGGSGSPTDMIAGGDVGLSPEDSAREEPMVQFVSFVLDDAQQTWANAFRSSGSDYRPAKLVLFRDGTQSGCGMGQSAMGPFYCPLDEKVYIDLNFFAELDRKFGAPGDFAQAYVLAHEIGHHVQNLQGINTRVRQLQQRYPSDANQLSVRMELQADCYAGVWANSAQQRSKLDTDDYQEGMGAASSVGDDRILQKAGRNANPESFTHGTAQQRADWFRRGFTSGQSTACDTFGSG